MRERKYKYRIDKVAETHCLICDEPIGNRPWHEVTILARFGQMLFAHDECDKE